MSTESCAMPTSTPEPASGPLDLAVIGGDGIGPEVIDAGVEVLKLCAERDG